jgi:hypothetical protein
MLFFYCCNIKLKILLSKIYLFKKERFLSKIRNVFYLCIATMKKTVVNNEKAIKSVIKMITDKTTVRSYLKGEISINKLTEKGIKLAKPI